MTDKRVDEMHAMQAEAAESVPSATVPTETAWLIEMPAARWGTGFYWRGPCGYLMEWGTVEEAVRFSRKVDAERVIQKIKANDARIGVQTAYEACEHSWSDVAAPAPKPQEAVACVKCGQTDTGQTGEHPCEVCGLPQYHDAPLPNDAVQPSGPVAKYDIKPGTFTKRVHWLTSWRPKMGDYLYAAAAPSSAVTEERTTDAERYRFIRDPDNARGEPINGQPSPICKMWEAILSVNSTPEQMDAAIDAAMDADERCPDCGHKNCLPGCPSRLPDSPPMNNGAPK